MNYCVQENINGRVLHVNLRGENVGAYSHTHTKYNMVGDDQIATLGDFWKVLRVRPAAYATYTIRPEWTTLEYLPNNTYSYFKVKKTLLQRHNIKVKPTRYWNETCVQDVSEEVLYSLVEYCAGMPNKADIVRNNHYLGIHPYRMLESICHYDESGNRTDPNVEATITALIAYGAIPNREQKALEDLMEKVQEVTNRYFFWTKNWSFLSAHRLLTMQLGRCNHIKRVLTKLLPNHPLNSANSASFTSNVNSGNPPAPAGSSSQSGGTMDCFSQSAYRHGQGGRGGRGY